MSSTSSTSTSVSVSDDDRKNALAKYFEDMSSGPLLTAENEAAIAGQLRSEDEEVWAQLFVQAPLVHQFVATIKNTGAKEKGISTRGLQSAATKFLANPTDKARASLERAARRLAAQMREFDPDQALLKSLLDSSELTGSQKKRIDEARDAANRTRNRFVESNLGLVVSVARRYQFSGMPLSDLIQEGNLGLLKAVTRFDERKGFRFSTYATWWIRHAIGRGVADKSRTVRLPVHVAENHQKIKRTTQEMRAELGREPTRAEVAKKVEMSVAKLEGVVRSAQSRDLSLDAPLDEGGDRERMDVFVTDVEDSAFERLSTLSLSRKATEALSGLAPIEQEILHRRFGLAGKTASTLQEIANGIGKSRERIRQIQEKALRKVREQLVAEHAIQHLYKHMTSTPA